MKRIKLNVTQDMLIERIKNTPLSDWASYDFVDLVQRTISDHRAVWSRSLEKAIYDKREFANAMLASEKRAMVNKKLRLKSIVLANTLKPGDVIKVRGVRDRTGLREVQSVDPLIGGLITAQKLSVSRWHSSDADITLVLDGRKVYCNRESYITTHGKDKVIKVLKKFIW